MNKKQIIASLSNIANQLDNIKDFQNANAVTNVLKKVAKFDDWNDGYDDDDNDGARCPKCGSYDVDTNKHGHPTKCLDCDWEKNRK